MNEQKIMKFQPTDFCINTNTADAQCFYFQKIDISKLCNQLIIQDKPVIARWSRIEVSDVDGELHWHKGATFVFIDSGSGVVKTENQGDIQIRAGDSLYIPPEAKHLSIASKGSTLIEMVLYISEEDDVQAVL